MKNFAPILMMLSAVGFYFVNNGGDIDITPERTDILSQVYKADRESRIEVLTEMQSMEFESDPERLDWLAKEIENRKEDDWRPFSEALAGIFTEDPNAEFKSLEELVEAIK